MKPQSETDISHAVRVLTAESDALAQLAQSINFDFVGEEFAKAVSVISKKVNKRNANRLIVAGIGKSGHVARKIAATLASTGTPAYYVHPGEASHGDMGMIARKDVVLLLSNSGENNELSDLMHYTKRFDITLIAMTGNPDSTLAQYADIKLIYPKVPEACPNGLAPTTSTTMMMAFGDALAVALLERRRLTPEQYKVFHPGGKLGRRLMKVSELMVSGADLPLVPPESLMDRTLIVLTEKNLGVALVVNDQGGLLGLVTDGDLKRHMAPDLLQRPVTEIMTKNPKSIAPDALAVEALDLMTKKKGRYLTTLVVMDGERLCGIIRLQDCLQAGIA